MLQVLALVTPLLTGGVITEKPSSAPVAAYVQKRTGKRVDYDGVYGFQCYDLMMHFKSTVYWNKVRGAGTALQTWKTGKGLEGWTRYSPWIQTAPPTPWSIIFIDVNHRKWHVWIVVSSTSTSVTVLEQNWGISSATWKWKDAIRQKVFSYKDILWWYSR